MRSGSRLWCLLLTLVMSSSAAALGFYAAADKPAQMLSVQLVNVSSRVIERIDIKHGNADNQESISVLRLAPDSDRVIGLNHQPGMGFSLSVHFADGEHYEMCVGKFVPGWFLSEVISDEGLDEIPGRYR
ncbi:hypothetical protein [Pontibacterium sp.]|uniref:hypothetical protein n=1 Tax=Pontibacterium sp. TaxID=2036026 RepID=UPI003512065C